MGTAPKHFADGAENAVWVVKHGWQLYPALLMQTDLPLPAGVVRVQWKDGQTELVYRNGVFTEYTEATRWVAQTFSPDDAAAEWEWTKEGQMSLRLRRGV